MEKGAFEEKCTPAVPPAFSFLVCLAFCIGAVAAYYRFVSFEAASYWHFPPLLLTSAAIYLWYRYGQMVHVYRLEKGKLIIRRGRTARNLDMANLSEGMIVLFCPYAYEGDRRPQGERLTLNACSSLRRYKKAGWRVYCQNEEKKLYCLLFEPSKALLAQLEEEFPGKLASL